MNRKLVKLFLSENLLDNLPSAEISEKAACKAVDPELFFSEDDHEILKAKEICFGCPVRSLCLEYGLKVANDGILGGLTAKERMALVKTQPVDADLVNEAISIRRDIETMHLGDFAGKYGIHVRTVSRWKNKLQDRGMAA